MHVYWAKADLGERELIITLVLKWGTFPSGLLREVKQPAIYCFLHLYYSREVGIARVSCKAQNGILGILYIDYHKKARE